MTRAPRIDVHELKGWMRHDPSLPVVEGQLSGNPPRLLEQNFSLLFGYQAYVPISYDESASSITQVEIGQLPYRFWWYRLQNEYPMIFGRPLCALGTHQVPISATNAHGMSNDMVTLDITTPYIPQPWAFWSCDNTPYDEGTVGASPILNDLGYFYNVFSFRPWIYGNMDPFANWFGNGAFVTITDDFEFLSGTNDGGMWFGHAPIGGEQRDWLFCIWIIRPPEGTDPNYTNVSVSTPKFNIVVSSESVTFINLATNDTIVIQMSQVEQQIEVPLSPYMHLAVRADAWQSPSGTMTLYWNGTSIASLDDNDLPIDRVELGIRAGFLNGAVWDFGFCDVGVWNGAVNAEDIFSIMFIRQPTRPWLMGNP